MKKLTDNFEAILKNPYLIYKIIRNYCRLFLKQHILGAVELAVTYDCNLKCDYCSSAKLRQKDFSYLTLNDIKIIANKLKKTGAFVINLTGGEPLLRNDIFDIIKAIKKVFLVTIVTNGHLLTGECTKLLKKISLDAVQISINDADPDNFQICKLGLAKNNDKMLLGLENAKISGLKVIINTLVTNECINSGEIMKIVKFCRHNKLILNLIIPCAVGYWGGKPEKLLTEESWRIFQDLCKIKGVRTDIHLNYFGSQCPAGTERIYVSAYGDVFPCDFIHISFGNLKAVSIEDILERMRNFIPIKNKKTSCLAGKDLKFIKEYLDYIQNRNLSYAHYKDFS